MVSINNRGVRELRRKQAEERDAVRLARTPEEHEAILNTRPGEARKERAKLGLPARPPQKAKRVRKPKTS
jgi:hypothetical protein